MQSPPRPGATGAAPLVPSVVAPASAPPLNLGALALECFDTFVRELRTHGLEVDPRLHLVIGEGLLSAYNLTTQEIRLSLPDLSTPMGRLQAMVLGSYLGCDDEHEVERFFRTFVPRLVAHELGHSLRHSAGRFGDDLWLEEQLANRLAVALTQRRMSHQEREGARVILRRALDTLSAHASTPGAAALTYEDVLRGLNASGMLDDASHRNLEVTRQVLSFGRRQALTDLADATTAGGAAKYLAARQATIGQINQEYASDFARYMYYHVGWLYLDLSQRGGEYVEDFARTALGLTHETLPPLENVNAGRRADDAERAAEHSGALLSVASDGVIRACFAAARELRPSHRAASRYFYKRYRELLWARLVASADDALAAIRREAAFFLESFDDEGVDAMASLVRVAPAPLRPLFPQHLQTTPAPDDVAEAFAEETDRRLYLHVARGADDPTARRTLERLDLFEHAEAFAAVPASSLIELAPLLNRVLVPAGDTLLWEHELNADVFFVASGTLDVFTGSPTQPHALGTLGPGEVLGEIAFFTRAPRKATVRARDDATCFVIRDADLTRFSFKHPSVVMQMAGALARRLSATPALDSTRTPAGSSLPPASPQPTGAATQ